ncbi:MAG: peptidase, partial [Eubacterium sp.]|nr:peptidase [Eubacterium sp.]
MDSNQILLFVIIGIVVLLLIILASCIKVVPQANAYIVERLGGYQATWGVGLHLKLPILDRVANKVLLKDQVIDFKPQPVIT